MLTNSEGFDTLILAGVVAVITQVISRSRLTAGLRRALRVRTDARGQLYPRSNPVCFIGDLLSCPFCTSIWLAGLASWWHWGRTLTAFVCACLAVAVAQPVRYLIEKSNP